MKLLSLSLFLWLRILHGAPLEEADLEAVLVELNKRRVYAGCGEVVMDSCLKISAQSHTDQMALYDWFTYSFEGDTPEYRVKTWFGCHHFVDEVIARTLSVDPLGVVSNVANHEPKGINSCDYEVVGIGHALSKMSGEFFWTFDFGIAEDAYPPIPHQEHERPELEIVYWANEHRKADPDCPMLQVNEILTRTARYHSADMASMGMITHDGSDGSTMWERAWTQGYDGYALENIASGFSNITETVVATWMEGESSAEFIMNCKNTDAGVGVYVDLNNMYYWTFMAGYSYPSIASPAPAGTVDALLDEVNEQRAALGCADPIALDACLTSSAQSHAQDMADNKFFSSSSSDGTSSGVRVRELFGCQNFRQEAILSSWKIIPSEFVASYMGGSARASKMLECNNLYVGMGYAPGYWAMDFGTARLTA